MFNQLLNASTLITPPHALCLKDPRYLSGLLCSLCHGARQHDCVFSHCFFWGMSCLRYAFGVDHAGAHGVCHTSHSVVGCSGMLHVVCWRAPRIVYYVLRLYSLFLIDVARNRLHERFLSPEHSSKLQESLRICAPAYSNCNVCTDTDMAKSSKHCKKHKRTVEVMVESLKSDPEKLKEFTDLRDNAPDEPPSAFASSVTEFELKFPGRGSGKKRGHTTSDVVVTVTKHTASTYVKKGTRLVMMHQEQWMKHAKEKLVLPPNEAKLRWDNAEVNTPKEATDQKGPAHSPLRLPMPKEDYVDGACEVGQSKEVNIESKRQKITNEEQVAEKQKGLTDGHASFNNEMFKKVGGSAMAAVAAVGGTAIGSLGQGSFGTIEQNSNIFAEQV